MILIRDGTMEKIPAVTSANANILELPDDGRLRQLAPARRVPTTIHSPPLTTNYQRNVHDTSRQRKQSLSPVQKASQHKTPPQAQTHPRNIPNPSKRTAPQRLSSPPSIQAYHPNIHKSAKKPVVWEAPQRKSTLPVPHTYKQNVNYLKNQIPTPIPPRAPLPTLMQYYQEHVLSLEKQNASSNRKKRKNSWKRTKTQIPFPSLQSPKRISRPCCTACALAKSQTDPIPLRSHARASKVTSLLPSQNPRAKITPSKPHNNENGPQLSPNCVRTRDPAAVTDLPFGVTSFSPAGDVPQSLFIVAESSPRLKPPSINPRDCAASAASPSHFRKKSPFSLQHAQYALAAPLHAKCLSTHLQPMALSGENQPVSTTLSPAPSDDETWFLRVFNEYTRPQRQTCTLIREHSAGNTKSSRHTIPIHNENRLLLEGKEPLFSKDLVDLIGDKNDERLRVLYKNPSIQESQPSTMCLVGSQKKRIKPTPKKMPWR